MQRFDTLFCEGELACKLHNLPVNLFRFLRAMLMNASQQQLDLTHKVHRCIQQQQWHQAKHHCQRLLKLDDKDAQVHQLLGLIHVQLAATAASADLRHEHENRSLLAFEAATLHGPQMFDAFVNLGNAYLQVSRSQDALKAYQAALALQPDSDLAYANQAEAYRQLHDTTQALASYGRALELAPHKHSYLVKAGNLLRELQRHEEAVTCYEQAINMEPDQADAYAHMAVSMAELGHLEAALGCCKIALEIDPNQSIAHYHKALLEMRRDDKQAALKCLNAALELEPQLAQAWVSKGLLLINLKDPAAALMALDRAIELGIKTADIHHNRAYCHKELKQLELAVNDLETALTLEPQHADALMTLGVISQEIGRHEAAVNLYTQAIAQNPAKAEAYTNLGAVLFELNRFEDALETLQAALDIDPGLVNAWSNLGATLMKLYQFEAALDAFDQVLRLDPRNVDAYCSQGLILHDLYRLADAMICYDKALAIEPECTLAHWNRSVCLLLQGDFEQGWPAYEARWQHKKLQLTLRDYPQPRWTGAQSLKGKRILIYAEQGLGDTLQFARFLPSLIKLGALVSFEVHRPLVSLLSRCLPDIHVFELGQRSQPFDLHAPLLSLPGILQCTASTIPTPAGYLSADSEKINEWQQRLGRAQRPRIGLVWRGNPAHQNDRNRSMSLETLLEALPREADYFCLQNQIQSQDLQTIEKTHHRVQSYVQDLKDFEDTAALCQLMDLVISVDTSVAHLSAALGKKTWTLIPYSPDWRWMLSGAATPWYQSMRLYRQTSPGSWTQALVTLFQDLSNELSLACPSVATHQELVVAA
jgi:tetratricopeptide (TPR) repeat protein